MPADGDTQPEGNVDDSKSYDPLGIIDWVIGGKYRVKSYLGGGGFGEVYAGYNENLPEQRLVIKFFKRVQAREKFAKEAKILCMLDHPNICRVIDYLPDEGGVVMAFIDGKDGGTILKETGSLPEKRFLNVARSVTNAIAYAHEKKIAHRDIKPGNIIIDKNEHIFLIDFGIAKQTGVDATKTAHPALTPMFAAPERQTGGKDYNPFLSDIYETGITLFNLATGTLPYRNPTNPDVGEWGGIAARKLSPELTRILKKATHPNPRKRYHSAADLCTDLKNLDVAYGPKRRRSKTPVAVFIIVAVLIAAGYFGRGFIKDNLARLSGGGQTEQTVPDNLPPPDETVEPTGEGEQKTPASEPPDETTPAKKEGPGSEVKTEIREPKEATVTPTPPPPPPRSDVLVRVIPPDEAVLTVAGAPRQTNKRFEIEPGRYEAIVTHPDFPLLRRTLDLPDGPAEITIDLLKEFPTLDTLELQVALIPPSDNHILEITRNGRKQTIHNFPYLGLPQLAGEWAVGLKIRGVGPAQGKLARVDSCAIYPFTPSLRDAIRGDSGILKVRRTEADTGSPARFLIYWSEN